eukprot:m.410795 g.410795  ORF g.410795 m.410795 type:complete len:385 (-) comp28483_c0_seq1:98-1252(-)
MIARVAVALTGMLAMSSATVFFEESFGEGWEGRWVQSKAKEELGEFVAADGGIKTSTDAKFYGLSAGFDAFSNEGKTLYVQFRVKHAQNIDCGGGYVKLFPSTVTGEAMDGDSGYNLMFGPDICGPGTRKVHVIVSNDGENHLTKKTIACKTDEDSHLYTLVLNADNTFEVLIDGESEETGSLKEDFDILKPKEIEDPSVSKPADWVDETQIDDPEDVKPADWVTEAKITDPEAEKPEDWDDEMDGEWEAPQIDNPEFKGEWKAKRIENPEYKGVWVHPRIANPEYKDDDTLYSFADFGRIGLDLWQVKAGSIFDDFLITDDAAAVKTATDAFKVLAEEEAAANKAAAEVAAAEAAAAKAEEDAKEPEADAEAEAAAEEPKDEL